MNRLLFLLIIGAFNYSIFAQVNRYTNIEPAQYEPRSLNEMMVVPMALQKKYNENQKYLYSLKSWILELKPQVKEQSFVTRLNNEYEDLTDIEDGDLARATTFLKQTENAIREIISDYNVFIERKNEEFQEHSKRQAQIDKLNNFINSGYEHQEKGEYELAIMNYTFYLNSDPDNSDVIFLRAMCKSKLNDLWGAIYDYNTLINNENKVTPKIFKYSTVYNNKAYCYVGLGKYTEALPLVEKALLMDKSEAYIWDTGGEIYYNLGEYSKSISDMDKAISIKESANSYFIRGLAKIKLNKKTEGCKDLTKAIELGEQKASVKKKELCK